MIKNITTYSIFFLVSYMSFSQTVYLESSLSGAYFKEYTNDFGMNTLDDTFSQSPYHIRSIGTASIPFGIIDYEFIIKTT